MGLFIFFFSSRRRHTRCSRDWSSDVCSSDLGTDVTERRRAEEALRRSEESSRTVVEHASHGIYKSTPDGRFLAANPALVRLLGYETEAELLALDMARDVYADSRERERILARFDSGDAIRGAEVA